MRTATRAVLGLIGVLSLEIGGWGLAAPRSWFTSYPGGGRHWLRALPPYNEHLSRDYTAAVLALGVLALWAAVTMDGRLVQAALLTNALAALPHAVYHLTTLNHFGALDATMSDGALWVEAIVPLALFAYWWRAGRTQAAPSP